MAGLLGGLETYDTASQARDSIGGPLVPGLLARSGNTRPIFDVNNSRQGLLTSERVDTQRIPITQTVLAEPVLGGRQATYRERDLLFVLDPYRGVHKTNGRYRVYNLQALNEVLEQRVRLTDVVAGKLRDRDTNEARVQAQKRVRAGATNMGPDLEYVPATVGEFAARVGWLGTMGADQQMDGGLFGGGATAVHPLSGMAFRAIATNVKAFAEVPPVFLSCDPEYPDATMPHAGAQVGLLVRHVAPGFYNRFHRYEAHEADGAPTPVPFLQAVPVWRSGAFPPVMPRRERALDDARATTADIEELSQNYYIGREFELDNDTKTTLTTLQHGLYLWLGTVETAQGDAPSREEQKAAIRSRQAYDAIASRAMLYVSLQASVGLPVPFAGY